MSITVTVQKQVLEQHPELVYQLFYLSDTEEQQEFFYVYTPKGYYRELTELLDLYQLPYRVYSSQDIVLLHILIIEQENRLADDLKVQLYEWGFGSVDIAANYREWREKNWKKHFALALIDNETLLLMSLFQRLHVLFQWLARPLVLLIGSSPDHQVTHQPLRWNKINTTITLQKPFTTGALRESIERLIEVVI
ncbi:MAG: hypothetical protein MUD08_10270 [Cytophagales bacterium]|jgi:hypothetical protein|nr:hypothetical protein [Cytophagales bacterium]